MNKYYNIIIISDGSSGGARGALAPPKFFSGFVPDYYQRWSEK